ncbi:MAG: hypothetical protein ABWZ76_11545 [Acidimicrobiales bacterium]
MLLRALEMLARRRRLGRSGTHPAWAAVSLAAFLLRTYQRRAREESIVLREELNPGESLIISHTYQPRG